MMKSHFPIKSFTATILIFSLLALYPLPIAHASTSEISGIILSNTAYPDRIHAGDQVTYTINVSNNSNSIYDFDIQDVGLGFSQDNVRLYPGDQLTYNITDHPTQDTINTASALVKAVGGDIIIDPFLMTANATVDVLHPAVDVTATVDPDSVQLGASVTYTITVTNSGDAWLLVDIVDDVLGTIASDMALDAGTVISFVVNDVPVADVTNITTVNGTDEIGGTVFASASTTVTVTGEDTSPPQIISRPTITDITPDSATISWQTDELADSTIIYGIQAGRYPISISEDEFIMDHMVTLDGLVPNTTYHFVAMSADAAGNRVSSRDITFTTLFLPDSNVPIVVVTGPLGWQGVSLVSADASDDTGVTMVEFFVDRDLVFTDYSAPFEFYVDTSLYENGPHILTNKAIDATGNSHQESTTIDVVNVKDATDPTVVIISPVLNQTISGKVTVNATLTDDTGLFKATMRIARKGEPSSEWWGDWYPPSGTPTNANAEFSLDSYSLENGEYRLAVEVYDKDINYGVGTVDITISNTPPPPPPNLTISRTVTRAQNYFTIMLNVKNTGGETATNVRLLDYLQLFQPIGNNTATAQYSAEYNPELTNWRMNISSNVDITPGQIRTYSYNAVPVMIYPGSITPMIGGDKYSPPGGSLHIWYESTNGQNTFYDDISLLFSPTTSGASYSEALQSADYLIVTNPVNLLRLNASTEVNQLLSSMAELAMLKNGVLGFLDVPPSYSRDFEAYDGFAVGDTLDDIKDEIIIGDMDRNLISTAHVPNQPLAISNTVSYEVNWQEDWGFECGNNNDGFDSGDLLSTGKVLGGAKDQIIMADSSADKFLVYEGNGKLQWCYAIETQDHFEYWDIEGFDGLAVGNLNGVGTEDVVFADRSENKVYILNFPLPAPNLPPGFQITSYIDVISQFSKDFEDHDGLAVGDVMGDSKEEIIIVDRSSDKIFIFSYTGTLMSQFFCDFEAGDGLTIGNVIYTWPTNKSEIIITDQDKDRIWVYQSDGKLVSSISRDLEAYDGLVAGNVHGGWVDEVIIADQSDDSLDIHNFTYAEGNKYQLKELIKADENTGLLWTSNPVASGAWSKKLKSDWISNGYLLIVGETDIIPAWGGKTFGSVLTTHGDKILLADITDYPYASTCGDDTKPELSIGRIIGNTAEELRKPIDTSIQIAKGTAGYDFDRSNAFTVSGYPAGMGGGSDSIDFQSEALKDALTLKNNGIDPIYMNTPDYTKYDSNGAIDIQATQASIVSNFFANTPGKDVIFLAGHGNGYGWDEIFYLDVLQQTNPFGGTYPFIFASSCSTGRYVHVYSVANAFLSRGAAVYLGATNWGLGTHQWISNYLYQSWDPGESIGLAVKEVKRSIGGYSVPAPMFGGGTAGYVVNNKERYWSAIYHVFGDPKYGIEGPPASGISSQQSDLLQSEPPNTVEIEIPYYEVYHLEDGDSVIIPGGGSVAVEGFPAIPYYQIFHNYPKHFEIQDIVMNSFSTPVTESGLEIPPVIISVGEESSSSNTTNQYMTPPGWWPEIPFTWDIIEGPETDTLVITVFPVQYNPSSLEIKFSQNYTFDISYSSPNIHITSLTTDRPYFPAGELVNIDLQFRNEDTENGQDVIVSAKVRNETTGELADGLPLRMLNNLRGTASCSFMWDSVGAVPGYYFIEIEIQDKEGLILAREQAVFTLIADFTAPDVEIIQPVSGNDVFGEIAFLASASDDNEVSEVNFWITGISEQPDILSRVKGIPATLSSGTVQSGIWTMNLDTSMLPDGDYSVTAEVVDSQGNTNWSQTVTFNIRNIEFELLLPPSMKFQAGRTIPIKFSLRVSADIDPSRPFVYSQSLEIRIFNENGTLIDVYSFGQGSENYRINIKEELYILNLKTSKKATEYTVEVWQISGEYLIGDFSFETVKQSKN